MLKSVRKNAVPVALCRCMSTHVGVRREWWKFNGFGADDEKSKTRVLMLPNRMALSGAPKIALHVFEATASGIEPRVHSQARAS